ncbi:MAG: hypothetical protein CSA20_06455 [Deltaproteobacteria bacterium]|nr:MAG: hypothetical protein CSA20_06455 [Deltaproteobacteria bacterium]
MARNKTLRKEEMLRILREEREIHLCHLAEKLSVSEMTARRYAAEMVEQVKLAGSHLFYRGRQEHSYSLARASLKNADKKKNIGRLAASCINAGESVFIDCGTTTPFVAGNLGSRMPLTVVCCSLNICSILCRLPSCNVIMTGGKWQRRSQVFSGDMALELLSRVYVDKAFISAAGIDRQQGLSCFHDYESKIKREVIRNAGTTFIVADSSKLGQRCPSYFADFTEIDALITDRQLSSSNQKWLREAGVEVFLP